MIKLSMNLLPFVHIVILLTKYKILIEMLTTFIIFVEKKLL